MASKIFHRLFLRPMGSGQSQILITLVPFLNVDTTKLIKIVKLLITLGKKGTGQSRILKAIAPL